MKKTILLLLVCMMTNGWLLANHWTPDDSQYQNNMTLTGVIQIDGVEQRSTTLEVGVFCGEECRGSILPTYFFPTQQYVVLLTIFGVNGDQLTFKLFDHALNRELNLTSPDAVTFTTNGYGSLSEPYPLNFTRNNAGFSQTYNLIAGWNWVSTYLTADDPIELLDMLKTSLGENGLQIQASNGAVTEFDGEEWFGDLDEEGIFNEQTYLIQTSTACTIMLEGMPAVVDEYEITINPDWNWIGFPSVAPIDLIDVLANFEAEEGDQIQCNDATSTEFDGEEWFGDLETFMPGRGYMYKSNSRVPKVLIFRTSCKTSMRPTMSR